MLNGVNRRLLDAGVHEINGVVSIPVFEQTIADVWEKAMDGAASDRDSLPTLALEVWRVTREPFDVIWGSLEDAAYEAVPEGSRLGAEKLRKQAKKRIDKERDAGWRTYLGTHASELVAAAEHEVGVAAELKRRAIKRAADEEERDDNDDRPTYIDVTALGDEIEPPRATAGMERDDGVRTLVPYEWNGGNGVPGAFKSGWAALHAVETFKRGGRVLWYDVDGNTAQSVISRLVSAGAPLSTLRNLDRFRLVLSDSPKTLLESVADSREWLRLEDLAVVDAAGGLVAAFGGNSNDADDWMKIYQQMLAPLVVTGAAGFLIDHHAKTATSTDYATGTGAKLKSQHGVVYNVVPFKDEPPRPNSIGKVALNLVKDTHGATGYGVGECVAVLEIDSRDTEHGPWSWRLMPARPAADRAVDQARDDLAYVLSLDPLPTSKEKLLEILRQDDRKWSSSRAWDALKAARQHRTTTFAVDDTATDKE